MRALAPEGFSFSNWPKYKFVLPTGATEGRAAEGPALSLVNSPIQPATQKFPPNMHLNYGAIDKIEIEASEKKNKEDAQRGASFECPKQGTIKPAFGLNGI